MTARHSTGVTEPVPAVDGDLLRDIGKEMDEARGRLDSYTYERSAAALLASEPMQRLRAAWTAELLEASGRVTTRLESELATAIRERDEARNERDNLRAEVDELTDEAEDRHSLAQRVDRQNEELGRLRAAVPDLPGVDLDDELTGGPLRGGKTVYLGRPEVQVDDFDVFFPDDGDHWHPATISLRESEALDALSKVYAARSFLATREAEERAAADTTTDDAAAIEALANALAEPIHRGLSGCNVPPGMLKPVGVASLDPAERPAQIEFVRRAVRYAFSAYPDTLRALDAHRSRTHGEDA